MIVTSSRTLTLPVGTVERVEVPDVIVGGYPDPTSHTVETALSAAAVNLSAGDALDHDDFATAAWHDATTIRSHLLTGIAEGDYGMWVRITVQDELVVRFAGRITFA